MESSKVKESSKFLFEACKNGDHALLKNTLKPFENSPSELELLLNYSRESDGFTPLMVATVLNKESIIEEFISIHSAPLKESYRRTVDIYKKNHSGATAMDLTASPKIKEILKSEKDRRDRLNEGSVAKGYHETSKISFGYILEDMAMNRFSMIGGQGGYFGGGIYFATNQAESSRKALHYGRGLECQLKLGKCYIIKTRTEHDEFIQTFCYGESPYEFPVDIMREELLDKGYDSVMGINDANVLPEEERILKTGDEIVVYSADQVVPLNAFIVERSNMFKYERRPYLKWKPISFRQDYDTPVRPTKPATYHSLNPPSRYILDYPTVEEVKQMLPNAQIENGDLIEFLKEGENITNNILVCIYHKTKTFEETLFYNKLLDKDEEDYYLQSYPNAMLLRQELLMPLLGFTTRQEFEEHYRGLLNDQNRPYKLFLELYSFKQESSSILTLMELNGVKDAEIKKYNKKGLVPLITKLSELCGIYTDGSNTYLIAHFFNAFDRPSQIHLLNKKGVFFPLKWLTGKSVPETDPLKQIDVSVLKSFIKTFLKDEWSMDILMNT